ncbi:MAG: ROK family protein [Chloroflexota bacterium]|nr:MAG: ROK family protein [Chloroflexota bacterium]
MNPYIGVDLGGTNLRAAVVDTGSGEILHQCSSPTRANGGHESVMHKMIELITGLMEPGQERSYHVRGIGIGVPGTPDIESGVIDFLTNLPGQWRNVPLKAIVEEQVRLPVALINDVRAMTLAEWMFGAGQGFDSIVCFAIGTGIGGGVVVNGRFHLGNGGTAGEFGHQVVEPDGPLCGCGGRGCLELYASGPAIAAMGVKAVMHGHTTLIGELVNYDSSLITAEVIARAAMQGDPFAKEILQRAGMYLGIAVGNVIVTVSPQRVIFGGGVSQSGDLLLAHVRQTVKERVHVVRVDPIEFVQARLGNQAGLVGAALWARQWIEQGKI